MIVDVLCYIHYSSQMILLLLLCCWCWRCLMTLCWQFLDCLWKQQRIEIAKYFWFPHPQTWNLSKIFHRRILSLEILHHQFHLILTVLVRKISENWEIYTAGKNFTLPPAVTAKTNLTSVKTSIYYDMITKTKRSLLQHGAPNGTCSARLTGWLQFRCILMTKQKLVSIGQSQLIFLISPQSQIPRRGHTNTKL